MKSIEDQMAEIRQRRILYTEKRQIRRLSLLAAGMGVLLLAVLIFAPGVRGMVSPSSSVLGAMILGPDVGGYVIVALLSFWLGIIITILTQKYRKMDAGLNGMGKDGKTTFKNLKEENK